MDHQALRAEEMGGPKGHTARRTKRAWWAYGPSGHMPLDLWAFGPNVQHLWPKGQKAFQAFGPLAKALGLVGLWAHRPNTL